MVKRQGVPYRLYPRWHGQSHRGDPESIHSHRNMRERRGEGMATQSAEGEGRAGKPRKSVGGVGRPTPIVSIHVGIDRATADTQHAHTVVGAGG
jgi:hypothetical protein